MSSELNTIPNSDLFGAEFSQKLNVGLGNARQYLLDQRHPEGHWVGELSSSALSTATAVIALQKFSQLLQKESESGFPAVCLDELKPLIERGIEWLVATQNADGGWGDTTISISNISTTSLVWAALNGVTNENHVAAEERCLQWLQAYVAGVNSTVGNSQSGSTNDPTLPPGGSSRRLGEGNFSENPPRPLRVRPSQSEGNARIFAFFVRYCGNLQQGRDAGNFPSQLARAVSSRYGRDRTFSVPILTALACCDRLGDEDSAWNLIPQLPFELAAFPHQMFSMLGLPVVSYALPALIAMGQARHCQRPTRNPFTRLFRRMVWRRTKQVLTEIQPTTGGFLEATPLTSFVIIALLGADSHPRAVIDAGIRFLMNSVRSDGSWPIDSNLATWGTTLSINALAPSAGTANDFSNPADTASIRQWLLDQQYRIEHPYTHAKPGGWAWTDLAGGVPDADDTSGALLALRNLSGSDDRDSAAVGIRWLIDLQNRDGGVPTFCRGWGTLPFDRSSADITAHAIRAWLAWLDDSEDQLQTRIYNSVRAGTKYLDAQQRADGAWAPLWFGNQAADPEENLVYGTSRVLMACAVIEQHPKTRDFQISRVWDAVDWMLEIQNADGGWGSEAGIVSSIEETGLAVESICAIAKAFGRSNAGVRLSRSGEFETRRLACFDAVRGGVEYLLGATDSGTEFPPSPIGFYFAKLWYFERLYPVVFALAGLESAAALGREGAAS